MKKKSLVIVISVIIVLLLGLFIIYYLLGYDNERSTDNEQLVDFSWELISIENPNYDGNDTKSIPGFTVMDRNLGASEQGWGKNASKESYGYFYQWGNNYGFDSTKRNIPITKEQSNGTKNNNIPLFFIEDYSEGIDYDGERDSSHNKNLWGGKMDSKENNWGLDDLSKTVKNRQGPCPDGFHVPSAGEWNKLVEIFNDVAGYNEELQIHNDGLISYIDWSFGSGNLPMGFIEYFKIPFAGYRKDSDNDFFVKNEVIFLQGENAYFHSSSPKLHYYYNASIDDSEISISDYMDNEADASEGISIRCFSNEYIPN